MGKRTYFADITTMTLAYLNNIESTMILYDKIK